MLTEVLGCLDDGDGEGGESERGRQCVTFKPEGIFWNNPSRNIWKLTSNNNDFWHKNFTPKNVIKT